MPDPFAVGLAGMIMGNLHWEKQRGIRWESKEAANSYDSY